MNFNIIVNKNNNQLLSVMNASEVDDEFLTEFDEKDSDKEFYSCVETDFNLIREFSKGKRYKYINNEFIEDINIQNEIAESKEALAEMDYISSKLIQAKALKNDTLYEELCIAYRDDMLLAENLRNYINELQAEKEESTME